MQNYYFFLLYNKNFFCKNIFPVLFITIEQNLRPSALSAGKYMLHFQTLTSPLKLKFQAPNTKLQIPRVPTNPDISCTGQGN